MLAICLRIKICVNIRINSDEQDIRRGPPWGRGQWTGINLCYLLLEIKFFLIPIYVFSDPSQHTLFFRPLPIFKSIVRPNYTIFSKKNRAGSVNESVLIKNERSSNDFRAQTTSFHASSLLSLSCPPITQGPTHEKYSFEAPVMSDTCIGLKECLKKMERGLINS